MERTPNTITDTFSAFRNVKSKLQQEKNKLILLLVTFSLCAAWFSLCHGRGWGNNHNNLTSWAFSGDCKVWGTPHYAMIYPVMKVRVASMWCAGRLIDQGDPRTVDDFAFLVGFYQLFWLVATILVLWFAKEYSLQTGIILFAGLMFSMTPGDHTIMFPWDMPSMFVWTLSYVFWLKNRLIEMVTTIVLGTLFKETVALQAFLLFFSSGSRIRQAWLFLAAFFGCVIVRLTVSHFVLHEATLFDCNTGWKVGFGQGLLNFIIHPFNMRVLMTGCGFALVAICLPIKAEIKALMVLFAVLTSVAAILDGTNYESRQYDDLLPLIGINLKNFDLRACKWETD